jgi:glycerol-3-phosphate dehydrogenase (NAD(P)+)
MATTPTLAVLGAGAWGTALANAMASAGRDVVLWGRDGSGMAEIQARRENARHLPGVRLEPRVHATADLDLACAASVLLAVVPTQSIRALAGQLAGRLAPQTPLVLCAKGIEQGTRLFVTQIVAETLPQARPAILSGPSFATDVAKGLPTAVTLAAADLDLAADLADLLAAPALRLYHSGDVRGVEIGGAAKNVLAIACGIAAGKGLGASAGAALVARGFAELLRFGRVFGGQPETFMGLSGLGDLVLTCGSAHSRNFAMGAALGRGEPPDAANHGKLAEGAFTATVLVDMARSAGIDMPISQSVDAVLAGRLDVDAAVDALLARPLKAEADCDRH